MTFDDKAILSRAQEAGLVVTPRPISNKLRHILVYDVDASNVDTLVWADDCRSRKFTLSHIKSVDVFAKGIMAGNTKNHPAKYAHSEVGFTDEEYASVFYKDRASNIVEWNRMEFYRFSLDCLRWFMESFQHIRAEGGGIQLLPLTAHQQTMHSAVVDYFFIDKKRLSVVVAKHRRAYSTTYWLKLIHAMTRLKPGTNSLFSANTNAKVTELVTGILLVCEDYLPPPGDIKKAHPFDIKRYGADNPDDLRFYNLIEGFERDRNGVLRPTEQESPTGGSKVTFMTAGARSGAIGGAYDILVFSEAGMDEPDWVTITNQSAEAMPKKGPGILVFEGTGEHGGSFLNQMVSIAEAEQGKPDAAYKLIFLNWLDDPMLRLPLEPGEKQVEPTNRCVGGLQRDYEELERIRKIYREHVQIDKVTDPDKREALLRKCEESLKWRRITGLPSVKYDPVVFNANHPSCLDDQRATAGNSVFDAYVVTEMDKEYEVRRSKKPEKSSYPFILPITDDDGVSLHTCHILHPPEQRVRYLVTVDPSMGVKRTGDPSAIIAWGFYPDSRVKMFAINDGVIPVMTQAQIAFKFAELFRSYGEISMVSVETVDKYGTAVINALRKMATVKGEKCPLYRMRAPGFGSRTEIAPGFNMNPQTKPYAIQVLRSWLRLWEVDYKPWFHQLASFQQLTPTKAVIRGAHGIHDDIVMATLQAAFIGAEWGSFSVPKTPNTISELPPEELPPSDVDIRAQERRHEETAGEFFTRTHREKPRSDATIDSAWREVLDPIR